ncbi:MAG: FAD-dependent oxidoreductase [Candidatus Izemoplasmataceae bacterium]
MFNFNIESTKETTRFDTVEKWDMLIIGGGPAGLNASLYAKRKGLEVGIVTDEIGGQLHNTTDVDNYLGTGLIEGPELSSAFLDHVNSMDVPILKHVKVKNLTHQAPDFTLELSDGRVLWAKTVLVATGGRPRKLDIPGEREFSNKGVTYCATCDAPFFKGKHVIVAGGGNSAAEGVLDLVPWADEITVVHRSQWRADPVLLEKLDQVETLTVHLESQLLEVYGETLMQGVKYKDKATGTIHSIAADGLLIEIGNVPTSGFVKDLVKTNDRGEILVDARQRTNVPGLFAAGDVTQQPDKQIIISAGEGAKAALAASKYLNENYKERYHGEELTQRRSKEAN